MGLPMFPRPINPTGVFEANDRTDTGRRKQREVWETVRPLFGSRPTYLISEKL